MNSYFFSKRIWLWKSANGIHCVVSDGLLLVMNIGLQRFRTTIDVENKLVWEVFILVDSSLFPRGTINSSPLVKLR